MIRFDILQALTPILCGSLCVTASEIREETKLVSLGAIEIDFIDILYRIETTFDLHIIRDDLFPEKKLESITVKDIIDFVWRKCCEEHKI